MKKKWIVLSALVVLLAAVTSACGSGPSDAQLEDVPVESLSPSTTISLDFAEQTDGCWEFYTDLDSQASGTWADQIYTDTYVIRGQMPKLVPADGQKVVSGGWSEDRTVYISQDGSVQLYATGLMPQIVYRTALFVPQSDGGTAVCYSSAVCQENEGRTLVAVADISCVPGMYEGLTLVITGNGELYTHTFDVQIQNVADQHIQDRNNGRWNGLYYDTEYESVAAYLRKDGPVTGEAIKKPRSGVAISAPLKKDIYTGYDGARLLQCVIALDQSYAPEEAFEVAYTLTEVETEQTVAQNRCAAGLNELGEFSCLTADILLPEALNAGEYHLSVEVFRLSGGQQENGEPLPMGDDTVRFFLRKEYDLSALYSQYICRELQFDLNGGDNQLHNEEATYLTLHDTKLWYRLKGAEPGVTYRCALIGETESGEDFCFPFTLTADAEQDDGCAGGELSYFDRSGVYRNVTILACGNGEMASHTFACEVLLPQDQTESEETSSFGRHYVSGFRWVSEYPENPPRPEKGYIVNIPEGSVLSGYEECYLSILFAFSPDYTEKHTVHVRLTEEATGRHIWDADMTVWFDESGYSWQSVKVGDFTPGAYILQTSADGLQTETRIFLEKEASPIKMFEAYRAGVTPGMNIYENAKTRIIPAIREYLDSMQSVDTDVFNQFLRYRYAPGQGMMGSFALTSPNVPEREKTIDQEDLLFTANWLVRDFYRFQLKDMKHYSDAQVIDLDAMDAFFGDTWKELKALDYAAGTGMDRDGTVYIWLPVYYENAQGGFEKDELYLFVYILYQEPDADYLDGTGYFNAELYNDYHTTQLLITDQTVVAELLSALNRADTALYKPGDETGYPVLQQGSEGDYVWLLQRRLQRLGYLTTSVDAVFTSSVQAAVAAWQKDMGMEESTEVTEDMQRILHDTTEARQLLMGWLKDRR